MARTAVARPASSSKGTTLSRHDRLVRGISHQQRGEHREAEGIYRDLLDAVPDQPGATHFLGLSLYQQGRTAEAFKHLTRSIALNPRSADYHNNLASVLLDGADPEAARSHAQNALMLDPDLVSARNTLGAALLRLGEPAAAVAHFEAVIAADNGVADAHNNLGAALQGLGRLEDAVACYRRAVSLDSDHAAAWNNQGDALHALERIDEAGEAYRQAYELAPNDGLRIKRALLLPTIYSSQDELDAARERLSDEVDALLAQGVELSDPLGEVNLATFLIAYQGKNDRDLMTRIAQLFRPHLPEAPAPCPPAPRRAEARRRIGFVSSFWVAHSVAIIYRRMVDRLSELDFDVVLFAAGVHEGSDRQFAGEAELDVIRLPGNLDAARNIIAERGLDALIYADIGMDPFTYFLAFTRLARVQCVLAGHPVTTGIPTIDYYLTHADLHEGDGRDRYSETLVDLPALPNYFSRPELPDPPAGRAALGLEGEAALYVCPMMLFKFHPVFDAMLAGILRRDPNGRLVLFQDRKAPHLHEALAKRFQTVMPDVAERIQFRPFAPSDEFFSILMTADVLLDSHPFGSGTTAYMAFATGVPQVTLPGADDRGRVVYSCYRKMGLADCIARDAEDYAEIAVRLGTDPIERARISAAIRERSAVLYDDPAGADAIAEFLGNLPRAGEENAS
jgi:protein O-GlcNAc transferase